MTGTRFLTAPRVAASLLAAVLLALPFREAGHAPPALLVEHLLLWAGAGAVLAALLRGQPLWDGPRAGLAGLLALLVVAGVSVARAPVPYTAFLSFWDLAMMALAFLLGRVAGREGEGLARAFRTGLGAYAILHGMCAVAIAVAGGGFPGERIDAGFLDPNHYATWLLLAAGALLADGGRWRVAGACALLLLAIPTGSRSGILAAATLAAAWVWRARGARWGIALLAAAPILAGGAILLVRGGDSDPYRYDRLLIWQACLPALRESPVAGIGIGMFGIRHAEFNFPTPHAPVRFGREIGSPHSEPLGLAIELGLLGIAAAGWALLGLGRDLRRLGAGRLGGAFLLAVPVAVPALFSMTLHAPAVALTLSALLGLQAAPPQGPSPVPAARTAGIAIRGLAFLPWLFLLWTAILAPYLGWAEVRAAAQSADPGERQERLASARRLNPWDAQAWLLAARPVRAALVLDARLYYAGTRLLDEGLARNSLDAAGWAARGSLEARASEDLFGDRGSVDTFRACFARAIALRPRDPLLRDEEARWLVRVGEEDAALARLAEAVSLEPLFVGARNLEVRILEARLARAPEGSPERREAEEALGRARAGLAAARSQAARIVPVSAYERTLLSPDAGEVGIR